MNLQDKRIVLTGASSGIGRALAVALSSEGAQLVLVARRVHLLEKLSDEIAGNGHAPPTVISADLSMPGAAATVGAGVLDAFDGAVDIVINNAGANLTGALSGLGDTAAARSVFEVNLWAPLALAATILPTMLAAGSGTVVNVTSTVQAVPLPLLGYYAASKAALAQATRSLRLELAETPVRVVEVIPGATDTDLRDIDELPWKTTPPPTLPPVTAGAMAAAIIRGLKRDASRIVYPVYSLAPLELPVIGRLIAGVGGRRVDTAGALTRQRKEQ